MVIVIFGVNIRAGIHQPAGNFGIIAVQTAQQRGIVGKSVLFVDVRARQNKLFDGLRVAKRGGRQQKRIAFAVNHIHVGTDFFA